MATIVAVVIVLALAIVVLPSADSEDSGPAINGPHQSPFVWSPVDGGRFFAPNSVWNTPLPARVPLDPGSAALVADLVRQRAQRGATINTVTASTPVYTVPHNQSRVRVRLDTTNAPVLQKALSSVPLPDDARPASEGDHNLVVWQPSTDTSWEFWRLSHKSDGWHASWGGRMGDVSRSPGYFRNLTNCRGERTERAGWGAPATSLAKLGGLITIRELSAGRIDHALAFAIPQSRSGVWTWPAQRTDGNVNSPLAIPEGARFRLDPSLDLNRLHLSRATRAIALAAQRYGMVLNNVAGSVSLYAEDPSPGPRNPYPWLFEHVPPFRSLVRFPFEHLQLLRTGPNLSVGVQSLLPRGSRLMAVYRIRVENQGSGVVGPVKVRVEIPPGLSFADKSIARTHGREALLSWTAVSSGGAIVRDVRVRVRTAGVRRQKSIRVRATLFAPRDVNLADNVASDAALVETPYLERRQPCRAP